MALLTGMTSLPHTLTPTPRTAHPPRLPRCLLCFKPLPGAAVLAARLLHAPATLRLELLLAALHSSTRLSVRSVLLFFQPASLLEAAPRPAFRGPLLSSAPRCRSGVVGGRACFLARAFLCCFCKLPLCISSCCPPCPPSWVTHRGIQFCLRQNSAELGREINFQPPQSVLTLTVSKLKSYQYYWLKILRE